MKKILSFNHSRIKSQPAHKSFWGYYPGKIPGEYCFIPGQNSQDERDRKEKSRERFNLIIAALIVMAGALVFFLAFFVFPGYIAGKI